MPDARSQAAVALVQQSITEILQAVDAGATLHIHTKRAPPVLHAHTFIPGVDRIIALLESESRERYFKVTGDKLGPVLVELATQWRTKPP
jgi:hypothetical protein